MKWFQGVLTGGGTVLAYQAWGFGGALIVFLICLAFVCGFVYAMNEMT